MRQTLITHHTVPVVSHLAIEVSQMAVLVPPGPAVHQGTVTKGYVIVIVHSGKVPSLMVGHSIT